MYLINMTDSNTLYHDLDTKYKTPLTVAMAVFNAERYLKSALDNILSQTYGEYELLIIDDGSTDDSVNIIKEFADKDDRIRYILKDKNEGLSSVRNLSIKDARGKYLMMIDADDLFESDTIAKAITIAEKRKADVVIWDYDTFHSDEPLSPRADSSLKGLDVNDRHKLIYLPAFMPVRLVRTDYARNHMVEFPAGLTKQDIPVHWSMVTDKEAKIVLLPERLFHYRQHIGATSARKGRSLFALAYVMDIVGNNLKNKGLYEEYKYDFQKKKLTLLHGMYDFISPELKDEVMGMINERLDEDAKEYLSKRIGNLSRRTQLFYRAINGDLFAKIIYKTFVLTRNIKRAVQ